MSLPDPLVPPAVDLRNFPFMPLEIERLRRSRAWLKAKNDPSLAFYMLNLWMSSWHEVPAGSLEDDDDVLADRAMCTLAVWSTIRDHALRGWVKCADGRLYHPVMAEKASAAWDSKQAQRDRTAAATAARKAQREAERHARRGDVRDVERNDERDVRRSDDATFTNREGQGTEKNSPTAPTAVGAAPAPPKASHESRGSRLPKPFVLPKTWGEWALQEMPTWTAEHVRAQAAKFADHWHGVPGKDGRKADWLATWRNWVRNAPRFEGRGGVGVGSAERDRLRAERLAELTGEPVAPAPTDAAGRVIEGTAERSAGGGDDHDVAVL